MRAARYGSRDFGAIAHHPPRRSRMSSASSRQRKFVSVKFSEAAPGRTTARRSERNIVIHVAVAAAGRDRAARRRARGARGPEIAAALIAAEACSAAAAVEHGERGVEALQHDLGGVFLRAALVGPFAGLQLALDVNLGALLQILLGDLAEPLVED